MIRQFGIPGLLMMVLFVACNEQPRKVGKPINLGDPTTIVTETDSQYLRNFTDDISPTKAKPAEQEISDMMVQVDSARATETMAEEKPVSWQPLQGFELVFNDCQVLFAGFEAHALGNKMTDPKQKSVAFVHDSGTWQEMAIRVDGLSEAKVEQRLMTRLAMKFQDELILLNQAGRFTSPFYTLAGKGNQFVSLGNNSLSFLPVDGNAIRNAAQRELTKKRLKQADKQALLESLKKVKTVRDQPCSIVVTSIQYRISGHINGNPVQKLVQFDFPQ